MFSHLLLLIKMPFSLLAHSEVSYHIQCLCGGSQHLRHQGEPTLLQHLTALRLQRLQSPLLLITPLFISHRSPPIPKSLRE